MHLKKPIFYRVLKIYFEDLTRATLAEVHVDLIRERLASDGDFSLNMPNGVRFEANAGICGFFFENERVIEQEFKFDLTIGVNDISDFNTRVVISKERPSDNFSNVYNISTQANIASAIIKGDLFIRNKIDGDSYFFGGMTHKLKKLFNDKKIPPKERSKIPVLCDEKGVVWVPGFGVRDDGGSESLYVSLFSVKDEKRRFYLPCDFKSKNIKKG